MIQVNIQEIKISLSRLLTRVKSNEEVITEKSGNHIN